jgi:tRNA(fMet)-specific endonuclease VapC
MRYYMLDTNTVSHLLKAHAGVSRRVKAMPMAALCISAITEGEMLFGLAKRPQAKRLHSAVRELLRRLDVRPWDSAAAEYYGPVRADMDRRGKTLAPLDLLIAAHALEAGAILVTNDRAFEHVDGLFIEDWAMSSSAG